MSLLYKYFRFPFAVTGDLAAIPDTVQVDGSVSYPQGFGPDYALDPATQPAALNIPRDKSNQLYNDVTTGMKYLQEGNVPQFIAAADNGGVAFSYGFLALVLFTDGYIYQSVATANVSTPGASATWVRTRIRLGANQTFYVATTGNNSNTGVTVGSPFLTAQFASDNVQKNYDVNGFVVTILRAVGAYTDAVQVKGSYTGAKGPASVIFDGAGMATTTVTTSVCYDAQYGAAFTVQNQKLVGNAGSGFCISSALNSSVNYQLIDFGATISSHISVQFSAIAVCIGNYTISGSSTFSHAAMSVAGAWSCNAITITITGTPAWGAGFVNAQQNGTVNSQGCTFSGASTGQRYLGSLNGVLNTSGSGANYFPGNAAGATSTGAQYA